MKRALGFLVLLLALAPRAATAETAPVTTPVEAFGTIPIFTNPRLSPDGTHLAAIQSFKGRPAVVIYNLKGPANAIPAIVDSPDWIVQSIRWVKSDALVLNIKSSRTAVDGKLRTWVRAIMVDADGKNARVLMNNERTLDNNVFAADVVDTLPNDPGHIMMSLYRFHDIGSMNTAAGDLPFYLDLLLVDVKTGTSHILQNGSLDTIQWFTDGNGVVVAREDHNNLSRTDKLFTYSGQTPRAAGTFAADGDEGSGTEGLSEDGKSVVRRTLSKGFDRLIRQDIATGDESELFAAPGYDVESAISDEWTGRIVGVTYVSEKQEYAFFDPKREALQRGIEKAFPGKSAGIVSSDLAADELVVYVTGTIEPPAYYLLDRTNHTVRPIAAPYPDLINVKLGEVRAFDYPARDGLPIHAYLTLPPGKQSKDLPLVVMPHGGPDARDMIGFDWWAQFLANRGYAVLQPNYRGSSGYGDAFTQAGLRQWGLKMQDDISDGVKKAITDGIADPRRVCIVGASYGGYAALAGAAFSPDLYACAVAVAGVSDLPQMLRTEHRMTGSESRTSNFWATRIGSSDENWDQLVATSPARHAAAFRAPVLLIHGEGDTTVRIDQSETMDEALRSSHKTVEFVRIPGEDHYLNQTNSRLRVLNETARFLEKYIGH